MNKRISILLFIVLLFQFSSLQANDHEKDSTGILFIGNSLTYTNDLPGLVVHAGRQKGIAIGTKTIAYANYALEDHWNDGEMQHLIASGKFNYVIVQQGPSSQADGRKMLLEYGMKIRSLCDQYKAKLVFFMVWPTRGNFHLFDGVIQNYSDAARLTQSILCPVGQVWKKHFLDTGDYSFYGPDQFHPSPEGSQHAAEMIVSTLFRN